MREIYTNTNQGLSLLFRLCCKKNSKQPVHKKERLWARTSCKVVNESITISIENYKH